MFRDLKFAVAESFGGFQFKSIWTKKPDYQIVNELQSNKSLPNDSVAVNRRDPSETLNVLWKTKATQYSTCFYFEPNIVFHLHQFL